MAKKKKKKKKKRSTLAKNGCSPLNIACITDKAHKNPYSQLHSLLHNFSESCDCFIRVTDCSIRVSRFFAFRTRKLQGGLQPPLPPRVAMPMDVGENTHKLNYEAPSVHPKNCMYE